MARPAESGCGLADLTGAGRVRPAQTKVTKADRPRTKAEEEAAAAAAGLRCPERQRAPGWIYQQALCRVDFQVVKTV